MRESIRQLPPSLSWLPKKYTTCKGRVATLAVRFMARSGTTFSSMALQFLFSARPDWLSGARLMEQPGYIRWLFSFCSPISEPPRDSENSHLPCSSEHQCCLLKSNKTTTLSRISAESLHNCFVLLKGRQNEIKVALSKDLFPYISYFKIVPC